MHIDHHLPVHVAHAVEDAVAQDAGVVDHAIDAAEILDRSLDHALGAGGIGGLGGGFGDYVGGLRKTGLDLALVIDQDSHEVLFSKNSQAVLPIASITKLMTAMVVLDAKLPLDEPVSFAKTRSRD